MNMMQFESTVRGADVSPTEIGKNGNDELPVYWLVYKKYCQNHKYSGSPCGSPWTVGFTACWGESNRKQNEKRLGWEVCRAFNRPQRHDGSWGCTIYRPRLSRNRERTLLKYTTARTLMSKLKQVYLLESVGYPGSLKTNLLICNRLHFFACVLNLVSAVTEQEHARRGDGGTTPDISKLAVQSSYGQTETSRTLWL